VERPPLSLGFLASHNGTDMQAIVGEIEAERLNATANAVISNNSKAYALTFASEHTIPYYHISSQTHENPDQAITDVLLSHGVELVIFSGYMKVVKENSPLLRTYKEKIWNPHPADPQQYGGVGMYGDKVHEAVLNAGVKYTLPTIHIVSGKVDGGPILAQGQVKIRPQETIGSLKPRVQQEEIRLFLGLLKAQTASS